MKELEESWNMYVLGRAGWPFLSWNTKASFCAAILLYHQLSVYMSIINIVDAEKLSAVRFFIKNWTDLKELKLCVWSLETRPILDNYIFQVYECLEVHWLWEMKWKIGEDC